MHLAAATGDGRWRERYDEHVSMLDASIAEAASWIPDRAADGFQRTIEANASLLAMEARVFGLLSEGRTAEAAAMLDSPDYRDRKRAYAGGMDAFLDDLRAATDRSLADQKRIALLYAAGSYTATGALIVAGTVILLLYAQFLRQRRRMEIDDNARVASDGANRAKSAFLAGMSHELRTPLNAILGYTEILLEDAQARPDPAAVADLRRIHGSSLHLLALINDVLDISKIESGKMEVYAETFAVGPLVDEVVSTVRPLAELHGNRIEAEAPAGLSMHSDATKLRQILLNLLGNAAKFTEKGVIRLRVRREGALVAFEVSDDGAGMTAGQQAGLFQAFSQVDAVSTRKPGGTGLGLAISRRLANLMGGDVSVVSESGRGSTFTVRLSGSLSAPGPSAVIRPSAAPSAVL